MGTSTKIRKALRESLQLKIRAGIIAILILLVWIAPIAMVPQIILSLFGIYWISTTFVNIYQSSRYISDLKKLEKIEQKQRMNDAYERYKNTGNINEMFNDILNDILNSHLGGSYNYQKRNVTQRTDPNKLDNAYKLLKLSKSDSEVKIKKRYRELAIKWHPDKWANSTEQNKKKSGRNFRKLNNAYEQIKKDKNIN